MNQAPFISRKAERFTVEAVCRRGFPGLRRDPVSTRTGADPGGVHGLLEPGEKRVRPRQDLVGECPLCPTSTIGRPLVRRFYFAGPLVDVAEQIIGPNLKAATSQLTFKTRGNRMVFPWHQDNGYGELEPYNALSCLTALDDTSLENGCLWVIPGSNRAGQQAHAQGKAAADVKHGAELLARADESKAVPVPMKAGESLVMSCWTLHKSGPNRSGRDRRILFFRYADADAVEVYNQRRPRLGRLLRGRTRFEEVRRFEADL